jgi:hypothetical protein
MIKIENVDVFGWEAAIRGMRSPMNSWDKSDSHFWVYQRDDSQHDIGDNDLKLMKSLSKAGTDHSKFLRMINVTFDITAPLYWWKEFDTYKVGTVANSCSTMHTIHAKEFTVDDFSHEHLDRTGLATLTKLIDCLNAYRDGYNMEHQPSDNRKSWWWQMIQLLPSSYNQKRTVQLNYQVLKSMYFARKNHKLDEWVSFCEWCETLPYFCDICLNN